MKSLTLDVADPKSIQSFAAQMTKDYPALNVLINNAGIMQPENLFEQPGDSSARPKPPLIPTASPCVTN